MRRAVLLAISMLVLSGCAGKRHEHANAHSTRATAAPVATATATAKPKPAKPKPAFHAQGPLITNGPRTRKLIALTFDADLDKTMAAELDQHAVPTYDNHALFHLLKQTRTPATIFLTGMWTRRYPDEVRRLAHNPRFELESHSESHLAWTNTCYGLPQATDRKTKRAEVLKAAATISRATGRRPNYFRFPGGCHNPADVKLVEHLKERPVDWDVVSGDAFNANTDAIVAQVESEAKPGSIVVAHCNGQKHAPVTAQAMARIIPDLRKRGFRFVTLQELLSHHHLN